jgi:hypothetical protein
MKLVKHLIVYSSLILNLFLGQQAYAQDQSAQIGPVNVNLGFCEDVQYLSSIMTSLTTINWPLQGSVGFTLGIATNPNVILDFCSLLYDISQLSTAEALFRSAEYLNKLTGNKWDDHLYLSRSLYDTGTSTFTFRDGKPSLKDGVDAQMLASRLNNSVRDIGEWSNKYVTQDDPVDVRSRNEIESDVGRLAQIAYSQKKYSNLNKCPQPGYNDLPPDALKEYEEVYQKQQVIVEDSRDERDVIYRYLLDMGVRIVNKHDVETDGVVARKSSFDRAYNLFSTRLNDLLVNAVVLTEEDPKTRKVKSQTIKEIKTKSDDPMDDKYKAVDTKIDQKYQNFKVTEDKKYLKEFKENYAERWNEYVTKMKYSSSFNLAGGAFGAGSAPERAIESEFSNTSMFCPPEQMKKGLDIEDPKFDLKYKKKMDACLDNAGEKVENANGLLAMYADRIFELNRKIKNGEKKIFTFGSKYFGNYYKIETKNVKTKYQPAFVREEVTCQQSTNVTDLQMIANKQQAVANEYNQIAAEKLLELNAMEKSRRDKERRDEEERDIRRKLERRAKEVEIENEGLLVPEIPEPPNTF